MDRETSSLLSSENPSSEKEKTAPKNNALPAKVDKTVQEFLEPFPDSPDYRRVGFFHALENKTVDQKLLDDVIDTVRKQFQTRKEFVQRRYEEEISSVQGQIHALDQKICREQTHLEELRGEKAILKQKKDQLKKEIASFESEFRELHEELGKAQKDAVGERLKEVHSELNKLVETYHKTLDSKFVNNDRVERELEDQRIFLRELKQGFTESYQGVKQKIDAIYAQGIGAFSADVLMSFGGGAALIGGWFFSDFAAKTKMSTESGLFYAISGFFAYSEKVVKAFGWLKGSMLMFVALLAVLLLISVVVFVCQYFLNRFTNDKSEYDLAYENAQSKASFGAKVGAQSFFSFWLQLVPWVLIAGIAFILISVGTKKPVEDVGNWLSAQGIGILINFLCAGLFFLYIVKVVEPRVAKSDGEKPSKLIQIYAELLLAVSLFSITILALMFGQSLFSDAMNAGGVRSLISFLCFSNITAITLGYGIRQKSILVTRNQLENKIRALSDLLTALAQNKPLALWLAERDQFGIGYLQTQRALFQLMLKRTDTLGASNDKASGTAKNFKRTLALLLKPIRKSLKAKDLQSDFSLSRFEELNFPEYRNKLQDTESAINDRKSKLASIQNKIDDLQAEETPSMKACRARITDYRNRIERLIDRQVNLKKQQLSDLQGIDVNEETAASEIREGFLLGQWTLQNQLALTPEVILAQSSTKI